MIIEHGQFGAWLSSEFGMSHATANNFMRVALTYGGRTVTAANFDWAAFN